jgi:hypothetical protein
LVSERTKEKNTLNGIDLIILAILTTTAIVIVGFAAKAYDMLRNDWRHKDSLLELKSLPPVAKKDNLSL